MIPFQSYNLNDEGEEVEIPINSTTCTISWSGIDVYISNHDLNLLAYGGAVASAVGSKIPYLNIACGITTVTFGYWASKYPDGAITTYDSLTEYLGGRNN